MLDKLKAEMKKAMLAKESFRLNVIRMVVSEVQKEDKVPQKPERGRN